MYDDYIQLKNQKQPDTGRFYQYIITIKKQVRVTCEGNSLADAVARMRGGHISRQIEPVDDEISDELREELIEEAEGLIDAEGIPYDEVKEDV